jgi:hypothetical protein
MDLRAPIPKVVDGRYCGKALYVNGGHAPFRDCSRRLAKASNSRDEPRAVFAQAPRRSASGSRLLGYADTPPLCRAGLLSSGLQPRALVASCGSEHQGIDGTGTSPTEQPDHDSHRPTCVPIIVEEQEWSPARDTFRDFGRYRERVGDRA